jgi:hypothetical protein
MARLAVLMASSMPLCARPCQLSPAQRKQDNSTRGHGCTDKHWLHYASHQLQHLLKDTHTANKKELEELQHA